MNQHADASAQSSNCRFWVPSELDNHQIFTSGQTPFSCVMNTQFITNHIKQNNYRRTLQNVTTWQIWKRHDKGKAWLTKSFDQHSSTSFRIRSMSLTLWKLTEPWATPLLLSKNITPFWARIPEKWRSNKKIISLEQMQLTLQRRFRKYSNYPSSAPNTTSNVSYSAKVK